MITTLTIISLGAKVAKAIAAESGLTTPPKFTVGTYKHVQEVRGSIIDWLDTDDDGHILDNLGDVIGNVLDFFL